MSEIGSYNREHDMEMERQRQSRRRQQHEQLRQEIQDRQHEGSELFEPLPPPLPLAQRQTGRQYANYNELHDSLQPQGGRRKRRNVLPVLCIKAPLKRQ